MKFRKKPVVVEAEQLTQHYAPPGVCMEHHEGCTSPHVHTLEGPMLARIGDWIIRGIADEVYPCKSAIFEATYEPADAASIEAVARELVAADDAAGFDAATADERHQRYEQAWRNLYAALGIRGRR
jgi:hypothetical protein